MSQKYHQPRIAVLASGNGTNFDAIQARIESGDLPAQIVVVISDNPQAPILAKAKAKGIPVFAVDEPKTARDQTILEHLQPLQPDLILALGYIKLISEPLLSAYPNRILNIHPGVLPQTGGKGMFGLAVHQKVLDLGLKETAINLHYVNNIFDEGEIIASKIVPVKPSDTPESLQKRILNTEYNFYWRVLKDKFCQ